MQIVLVVVFSYLLGSIPFGYLLVRALHGSDVRSTGSGNIGATNVSRTSPVLGVATLLLDGGKGLLAVFLALKLFPTDERMAGLAALFAVVGHVFPAWLKFRGGKGVATGLGAFALLTPMAVLASVGIFLAIFLLLRFVSLASIAMFAALPVIARALGVTHTIFVFLVTATLLIVLRHHENIQRLWNGKEARWGAR